MGEIWDSAPQLQQILFGPLGEMEIGIKMYFSMRRERNKEQQRGTSSFMSEARKSGGTRKGIKSATLRVDFPSFLIPPQLLPLTSNLTLSYSSGPNIKMQSFASLAVLLFLALSSVIASPVEKRASLSCESTPITTRRITTSNTDPNAMYPTVFSLGNTTTQDHYGTQAKVLISTKDDGTPFTIRTDPQSLNFDFIVCNSTYMNTKPSGSAYTELVYGILRPAGQTQHCIQAKTGSVETPDQVFTNSKCSYSDDSSQLGSTWSYFPNDGSLKFISTRLGANQHQHPTFLTTSSVGHHALKLNAGSGSGISLSMAPGA